MNARMTIALFRDHPAEHWPSMERYANGLEQGLRHVSSPHVEVIPQVPPSPWPGRYGLLLSRAFSYPLWARRRQGTINHVLDHSYGHLVFALDASRTVVTVHDVAPLLFRRRLPGLSRILWMVAWRGARRARYLIAVSHATRRLLVEHLGVSHQQVGVIYEGVEPLFCPRPAQQVEQFRRRWGVPETPLLLHVGHTQPRKNLEGLLRALAILRKRVPNVVLLQVGGIPTLRQQRLIATLSLAENVRFLGRVDDEALVLLYNLADVFVFPSLYEGFGFPVLEAMACGTPVVASNTSSLPEVVGDAGLLVDPRSPESIAVAIHRLLSDPDLRHTLRRRGRERAAKFSWERTARETLAVYESLLSGKVPTSVGEG